MVQMDMPGILFRFMMDFIHNVGLFNCIKLVLYFTRNMASGFFLYFTLHQENN